MKNVFCITKWNVVLSMLCLFTVCGCSVHRAQQVDTGEIEEGYGLKRAQMNKLHEDGIPFIDYHVHLRGGMTVETALERQAATGIRIGVLKNIGKGWPIENDTQLKEFIESVQGQPLFAGLQVNDRDWMNVHDAKLLKRLDFILGDTMIMAMPNDDSPPVKLWKTDLYKIDDPEAWMKRYVQHNIRVLSEPITILANPTWLPKPVEDRYDELWTDERMKQIIEVAVKNNVALEINAGSGYPHERFILMAKKMGSKFTFGTNNFDCKPMSMRRCYESIEKYGLKKEDLYVPGK